MAHLFTPEKRDRYSLESLWKDAVEVNVAELLEDKPAKKAAAKKPAPEKGEGENRSGDQEAGGEGEETRRAQGEERLNDRSAPPGAELHSDVALRGSAGIPSSRSGLHPDVDAR